VQLVGFITRIYHDAWSLESQIKFSLLYVMKVLGGNEIMLRTL